MEDSQLDIYDKLCDQKKLLEDDLQTINHIYGKVTSSHDYKEFANQTNQLRQKVESYVKAINAKIAQMDADFKRQAAYQEMLRFEKTINELKEKYA